MNQPAMPPPADTPPPSPPPGVVEKRVVEYRGAGLFRQFLLFVAGLLVGANGVYFWMQREMSGAAPVAPVAALPTPGGTGAARIVNEPAGIAMPASPAATAGGPVARTPLETPPANAPTGLQVPVQGVSAAQLSNTFDDARGQNRVHDAIDIMAAAGTPVLAAADGKVVKLFESKQGGTTLYQFDPSGRYVYYYAHLQGYAPGIAEGGEVKRGEVIGQVGSSGNASPDAPHLHFAIGLLGPEGEWWDSTPINPYPLLGGK